MIHIDLTIISSDKLKKWSILTFANIYKQKSSLELNKNFKNDLTTKNQKQLLDPLLNLQYPLILPKDESNL